MAARDVSRDDQHWLERVREFVVEALEGHQADVWLFGSRARRDHRSGSDVDVAVSSPRPLPPHVLPRLRERLEESTIPLRVDVVDLSSASPALKARVREEGVRWSAAKSA